MFKLARVELLLLALNAFLIGFVCMVAIVFCGDVAWAKARWAHSGGHLDDNNYENKNHKLALALGEETKPMTNEDRILIERRHSVIVAALDEFCSDFPQECLKGKWR